MAYAKGTKVEVVKTKADIESLLEKHNAKGYGTMVNGAEGKVVFSLHDRNVMFRFAIPDTKQAARERWRAVLLVIKAKLESVESGIETFEEAFLGQVMTPSGETVYQQTAPRIEAIYSGQNVPLLLRE